MRRHETPVPVNAGSAGLELRATLSNAVMSEIHSENLDVPAAMTAEVRAGQGAPAAELSFPPDSEDGRSGADNGNSLAQSDIAASPAVQTQVSDSEVQFALAFTRIVSVLIRSEPYRQMALGALEALVVPPILAGQFAIMDTQVNGQTVPVALALWASVSTEVDQKLSDPTLPTLLLNPDEWRSGQILWLIDAVGDGQAVRYLLQKLNDGVFADLQVKMRRLGVDGVLAEGLLSEIIPASAL